MPDAAASILDYFDRTYVHGSSRKIANSDVVRRIEHLFPPEVWNVHDITVSAGDITNNFAEAWNRRFETMIGHKSPSIWLIIEVLGDDAAEAATTLLRHNSGRLEPRRVKNYCVRDFNKRLQRLCAEYDSDSRDIKSFLHAVGHCIRLIGQ